MRIKQRFVTECVDIRLLTKIVFVVDDRRITYYVTHSHLSCIGGANDTLFRVLGIRNPQHEMSKVYGYPACSGNWPVWKDTDLTLIVTKIIAWAESKGVSVILSDSEQDDKEQRW